MYVSYYVCLLDVCLLLLMFARCVSYYFYSLDVSCYVCYLDVCLLLRLFARCVSCYVCSLDVCLLLRLCAAAHRVHYATVMLQLYSSQNVQTAECKVEQDVCFVPRSYRQQHDLFTAVPH